MRNMIFQSVTQAAWKKKNWVLPIGVEYTLKIKKIFFSPQVPIQPWRLKPDSAPPGAIWTQFKPKLSNQKAILTQAGGHFSPRLALIYIKGAKLD